MRTLSSVLRQMPNALRHRYLRTFLKDCGVKEPERHHTTLAEKLVFSENPSARGQFPGGVVICRNYDRLEKMEDSEIPAPVQLACPGVTELPQWNLRIVCTPCEDVVAEKDTFTVSPQGTLWVRTRQEGDSICLPGGTKTLKKLFIDRKIPRTQRPLIPVLADDAGVVAVGEIGVNRERLAPGMKIEIKK